MKAKTVPRKSLLEQVRLHREEILASAQKNGARNVRIFGSVARREDTLESDIDLLVEMEPQRSLFDLVGFSQEVEEILGVKADVVSEKGLNPHLEKAILLQAVYL